MQTKTSVRFAMRATQSCIGNVAKSLDLWEDDLITRLSALGVNSAKIVPSGIAFPEANDPKTSSGLTHRALVFAGISLCLPLELPSIHTGCTKPRCSGRHSWDDLLETGRSPGGAGSLRIDFHPLL
jgi:hypothetical protein